MRNHSFACFMAIASLPACGNGAGASTPTDGALTETGDAVTDTSDGPTCETRWSVRVPSDGAGSLLVEGGALHLKLTGTLMMSNQLQIWQSKLTADFDATFRLDSLTGHNDCSVTAFVGESDMPSVTTKIEFVKTGGGYNLVAWNGTSNSSKFTSSPTASLHLRRAGTKLFVEGVAGSTTHGFETPYPDLPVTLGLYLMCPFGGPGEATLSDFSLTGGAPGKADDFSCDARLSP